METTSIEVEFSQAESAILRRMLEDRGDVLRERWGVETMAGLVHLLAMHGADEFGKLLGDDLYDRRAEKGGDGKRRMRG